MGERLAGCREKLEGSKFTVLEKDGALHVTDPWGSQFRLVQGGERDSRGQQDGGLSEGFGMSDLTLYCPANSNMGGIERFYEQILGAVVVERNQEQCVVATGPQQTLTFRQHPAGKTVVQHEDLRDDKVETPEGFPTFESNYGPHVSIYVADLPKAYRAADAFGLIYVNPRFKRRAYTLEEAVDQCIFRCLNIVDPDSGELILKLEHEVRSVVQRDGAMYKSCPFDEIPQGCRRSS